MNASLMVRLSTAANDRNLSRDGMLRDLRELAAQLGLTVVAEHVDDGISGAVRDRPGFMAWLDDARFGRADVLLAWSGDRITREGVNAAAMVLDVIEGKDPKTGKVVRNPVRFISFDDRLDSNDGESFRLRFVITAEFARAERERAKSRNKARVRRMMAEGKHVGNVPYGYRTTGSGVLVPDGAQAEAIREAARRVLDGQPVGQVARWLDSTDVRPRKAKHWSRNSLVQILRNEHLAGVPLRPGAPAREPILPMSTITELRRVLGDPETLAERRKRNSSALLAGLLVCWSCERPMRSTQTRHVCMSRADGGHEACQGAVSINRKAAEEYVTAEFVEQWGGLAEMRRETTVVGGDERDRVDREIAAVLAEMATAYTPDLGTRLAELQARKAKLAAEPVQRETRLVPTGRTIGEAWEADTIEDRRDRLRWALDAIVCHPRAPGRTTPESRLEVRASRAAMEAVVLGRFGLAEIGQDVDGALTYDGKRLDEGQRHSIAFGRPPKS